MILKHILGFIVIVCAFPFALLMIAVIGTIIPFLYALIVPGESIKDTMLYWEYEIWMEKRRNK